jgi:hypothetical protein
MEQPPKIEIENNIEALRALEKEGKYVFHGSSVVITELEPRQPMNLGPDRQMVEHGKPCVAASQMLDIAIFRAVVNNKIKNEKGLHWSSFGYSREDDDTSLNFKTMPEVLEKAKESVGYVHVFLKDDFEKFDGIEYRAYQKMKPLRIFKVGFQDLPANIDLEEMPENAQ